MKIIMIGGKGGVGKTLCATSLALVFAERGEKTAIIDYDAGHSVSITLGITKTIPLNTIHQLRQNLAVAIVESLPYESITESKKRRALVRDYLTQFPEDLGIVPYADIANDFFGVPTDPATLYKFSVLVMVLSTLNHEEYGNVVIDVEPTAGFERLLSHAEATARSLYNLKHKGIATLTLLRAKWPEIRAYLRGSYIQNAETYASRIMWATEIMKNAYYLLVSTPKRGPVLQALQVGEIIEKFGGTVRGYIANDLMGKLYEAENIALLTASKDLPIVKIRHQDGLEVDTEEQNSTPVLREVGSLIVNQFIR